VPGDFGDITWWIKPPRVVPLELVREVTGRLNYQGRELEALDEDEVRAITREFRAMGIQAIAVSLLHSYRRPDHEERVRELVKEVYPDCYVSISADVIREYREYERTLSTCLNTGLMPLVSSYIGKLHARLDEDGLDTKLYVMKSSGGITDSAELVPSPISAVLSGPAAGVVSAAHYATETGYPKIITMDIGGTSTDICLIDDGVPHMLTEGRIDVFDIKTPMLDIHTVGAGGGSIAWLAAGRSVRVGPQSAGASPGPACYGRGGGEPTLTDAHLLLGRLSPYLLGGSIELDLQAAREAIDEKLAKPLGMSVEEAAVGMLDLATTNIAQGINVVSVKRGRDPRGYTLMAFGGAGGLNACPVGEALRISTVLIPPAPGATSAEGLLSTDVRFDRVLTHVQREDHLDVGPLTADFDTLATRLRTDLAREGFTGDAVRLQAFADMRYIGQAYELRVPVELQSGGLTEPAVRAAMRRFHVMHDDQYGYQYEGREPVELVNIGVTGYGLFPRPRLSGGVEGRVTWEAARKDLRSCFVRDRGWMDCPVYERPLGPTDGAINGPAIVEQYDSTLFVDPGWTAQVDQVGQIILTRAA
jgi:N-methylhydantoinase A